MKQFDHIYTNTKELSNFMNDKALNEASLVQVFTSDKALSETISAEVQSQSTDAIVTVVLSETIEQGFVRFTKLPADTKVINKINPAEFKFFHSGPVVIFKREPKDDCWIVTNVTQSVSQWGYTPEYFIQNKEAVKKVFHKDDIDGVRKTLIDSVELGKDQVHQQYRINKNDGSVAWVSEYTQIIRNAKNEPIELIGYLVDITQDKDHEALYAGIINTTSEGFWLLDSNLKIIDVNYSLCAMLGFTKDEMIGHEPYDFIAPQDISLCQKQEEMIDDVSNRIYEITLKSKKGTLLSTLASATTMHDEYGNMKTFAFMTDISSQKKTEEELRSRHEEIESLNDSLESKIQHEVEKNREKDQMMYQQSRLASMGEMIGNIAHQWRQPLNIIALVMQDLYISDQLGNLNSKKVEDSYDKANNILQYMSQTIDDFRNFFKQGNEQTEFSLKEVIDSVHNLVSTNLSYNHISCNIEVKKDSLVKGGLNEFKQVLINVLNNAQEAIQGNDSSKKIINILVSQKGSNAVVKISDDGGGMSLDVIEKIFDPYFTTKNKTQGTGLGLYMSKQIIENTMCGSLSAKNLKQGAEFTINLPL